MSNLGNGAPDGRPIAFGTVFLLAHHLDRLGDVVLAPLGLTTKQWLLLAVIARGRPGRDPSLTEAAALYGSSRQNVKAIARGLEERGYLRLVADPRDRRTVRLQATSAIDVFAGREWAAREAAFFAFAFDGLGPGEVADLAALLGRWLAAVAPTPRGLPSLDLPASPAPAPRGRIA